MGIFDIFRRLLQDRNNFDASEGQEMRRRREAERILRGERKRDLDRNLRRNKRLLSTVSIQPQQILRVPSLANIQVYDILGFQPQKHRRRRK